MGGTFDPVHLGHLRLAEEAAGELGLERVRWIPSGNPGHRTAPRMPAHHRLEMVKLAVSDNPRFGIDDAEASGGAAQFTIDTLRRLRAELGGEVPLVLIIGADQLHKLDTWRDWRELFDARPLRGRRAAGLRARAREPAAGGRRGVATPRGRCGSVARGARGPHRRLPDDAARHLRVRHPPATRGGCERALLAPAGSSRLYSDAPALLGGRKNRLMDIRKKQKAVVAALEDVKARDIAAFDVTHLSSLFDRVIIATADSARQTKALASRVQEKTKALGEKVYGTEGEATGEWVLIDLGDIVVHIMQPAIREYYNLEELWGEPKPRPKRARPKPKSAARPAA